MNGNLLWTSLETKNLWNFSLSKNRNSGLFAESTINECISDDDRTTESEFYTTIEDQEMFSLCFPNVVYDFESTSNSKRNQKKGNKMTTYVLGRTLITLCGMI